MAEGFKYGLLLVAQLAGLNRWREAIALMVAEEHGGLPPLPLEDPATMAGFLAGFFAATTPSSPIRP